MCFDQRFRALEQEAAEPLGAVDETCGVKLTQCREAGSHRQIVRGERRAMADRVLERVEDAVVHRFRHQQRPHRHVAAGERLRDRDQIRLEPPVLEREQLAGAPEAGLHLVDAEERPVAAAELLRAGQVTIVRELRSMPLNGLDDEDRHVLAAERRLERLQIVERDP